MAQPSATATGSAPSRRRPPRFLFRYVLNPLFGLLLRSPLHAPLSKRLLLLTFTGRTSGKRYTIPVGYVRVDGMLLLGTESAWSRNLRGGAPVRLRLCGEARTGTADIITDEAGMTENYRIMLAAAPGYGRAIGVSLDPSGEPNVADVARARQQGHVAVRIELDPPAAA